MPGLGLGGLSLGPGLGGGRGAHTIAVSKGYSRRKHTAAFSVGQLWWEDGGGGHHEDRENLGGVGSGGAGRGHRPAAEEHRRPPGERE